MPENDPDRDDVLRRLERMKIDGYDQMDQGGMPGEAPLGNEEDFPQPPEDEPSPF